MKKIICDRCGKEIESPKYIRYTIEQLYTLSQRTIWNSSIDLCGDCQHEMEDSLEKQEPTQEAETEDEE